MVRQAPDRLLRVVDLLDLRPGHRVLEIGGGTGVAAALVLARLGGTGAFVGADRSAQATAAAERRNADAVAAGHARFITAALAELRPGEHGAFDRIFAVNVNAFWTSPVRRELSVVRALLAPAGVLWICYGYDAPPPSGADRTVNAVGERLSANGFTWRRADPSPAGPIAIRAVIGR
jgi:cyclopropane fatty-acyl-phospholipid synthase-like methyltransferase